MSFGGDRVQTLDDAVGALTDAGAVVVAAAGNEGIQACNTSPAGAPDAFSVAASSQSDVFAKFSNYGSCVSLVAPGVGITSDWIGSPTATQVESGTSMSAPLASGAAAQYLQANPGASVGSVKNNLKCSATSGALSGLPSRSTPNLLLYTPPQGFTDSCAGSSGAAGVSASRAAAAVAVVGAVCVWLA